MMKFRSTNPVLKGLDSRAVTTDRPVTYANVAMKTVFLIGITVAVAIYTITNLSGLTLGWIIGAFIVGLISVIIGTRSVKLSPIFSVIYAASEGLILGVISSLYASVYEGIIPTALTTTLIVLLVMMLLFSTGVIKITRKFASFLMVGLITIVFMSLISLLLPSVFFVGPLYYVFVGLSAILSIFFLLLDFESIKNCVEAGTDSSYGWILSLGLMVTIVWIYVQILRILAIVGGRRN